MRRKKQRIKVNVFFTNKKRSGKTKNKTNALGYLIRSLDAQNRNKIKYVYNISTI